MINEELKKLPTTEVKRIRYEYVKKYIGDFSKPNDYHFNLRYIDHILKAKS